MMMALKEILELAAKKEVAVHITKNAMIIDGSMQSTITATILSLAAPNRENLSPHEQKKHWLNEKRMVLN